MEWFEGNFAWQLVDYVVSFDSSGAFADYRRATMRMNTILSSYQTRCLEAGKVSSLFVLSPLLPQHSSLNGSSMTDGGSDMKILGAFHRVVEFL